MKKRIRQNDELETLISTYTPIWKSLGLTCRLDDKGFPPWLVQVESQRRKLCFSGIFWFPNLLPPGRARVESLASNAYADPGGFRIRPRLTLLHGILDFTPDIENAQLQNLRVGLTNNPGKVFQSSEFAIDPAVRQPSARTIGTKFVQRILHV